MILTQPPYDVLSIEKYLSTVSVPLNSEDDPTFSIPALWLNSLLRIKFEDVFVIVLEFSLYKISSMLIFEQVRFSP